MYVHIYTMRNRKFRDARNEMCRAVQRQVFGGESQGVELRWRADLLNLTLVLWMATLRVKMGSCTDEFIIWRQAWSRDGTLRSLHIDGIPYDWALCGISETENMTSGVPGHHSIERLRTGISNRNHKGAAERLKKFQAGWTHGHTCYLRPYLLCPSLFRPP